MKLNVKLLVLFILSIPVINAQVDYETQIQTILALSMPSFFCTQKLMSGNPKNRIILFCSLRIVKFGVLKLIKTMGICTNMISWIQKIYNQKKHLRLFYEGVWRIRAYRLIGGFFYRTTAAKLRGKNLLIIRWDNS